MTSHLSVCETKNLNYSVASEKVNCEQISQNVCFDDYVDEKQVCRQVPQTVCKKDTAKKSDSFPESEVSFIIIYHSFPKRSRDSNLQVLIIKFACLQCKKIPCEVCGPEKCPIITKEVCEDKEKTVSSETFHLPNGLA